ncbi:SCP2 sterol-binding domain-containing protein [Neptuniibacter pectenicola]|jgi:putative sterol carrier protein|uniref:SCP2 sterol-binding domain-containing protein n=1 Tax=Neptuniibacter pectenicola TaxID=1806669 RepID=A0ABU9TRD1_9GAMM|nr:SCP2 sterol-binding domain-containing protein [Neptuniibacter pectenicola]KXJ57718.1 MAG: SCP-2 family sterol carrier protein [Neptuniibacter sp. Phe_28]|tara:strand:+ start:2858 stop:3193 length:336 start_codon:yes stop_codon:yes gene_type:complete
MSHNITVANVIEKLPSRFVKENATDFEATFQFTLDDEQDFHITIAEGACSIHEGEHPDPNVTLIMDAETMVDVITGQKDGMSAFMTGKLRAEGNVMLATKLSKLFSREKQR